MRWLDTWHRAERQEASLDPDYLAKVLPFPSTRKQRCVDANRAAAEQMVFMCSDEDLTTLCRDLGDEVIKAREAYYTALEAQAKALNELQRRACRG